MNIVARLEGLLRQVGVARYYVTVCGCCLKDSHCPAQVNYAYCPYLLENKG